MKHPIKIYLGDLTYDTIALSTEVFPLNVGYVGAYCLERFGDRVEVRLFKYIEDLDKTLNEDPPDILGLSNYCWNQRVGLEIFRMLLARNPHALTVWGGPNFPADDPSRQALMDRYQEVDAYVPIEGEIGFSNLVQRVLDADSREAAKPAVRVMLIDGCVTRRPDGAMQYSSAIRSGDLDTVPSPYLMGLMDRFFDGRLVPMLQTNRGCPFRCSFCVDGSLLTSKVNYFTLDRVTRELEYIAPRVPPHMPGMEISDLNFGMYKRDVEICDAIRSIQDRYGWPKHITTSTGKNRKERVVEAVSRLNGTLRLTMSVQSTNPEILSNIKRDNISLDAMMGLAPKIKEAGLRTYSEIILSLPGETYETHLQTVRDLAGADIDFIKAYTLMLLDGSELATPEQRQKWGFVTKFRPLTMDFAELSNGRRVIEIEEVVIGSNTLSYDEYVDLRVLAFTLWIMTREVAYDALLKFLKEHGTDVVSLFLGVKSAVGAPERITGVLDAFRQATIRELWDSPEEIEAHYQDDAAYKKLLNGEEGINLLNYFGGVVTAEHMEEWTDFAIDVARGLLREQGLANAAFREFEDVAGYCRGITYNVMRDDRMQKNPEIEFHFDVEAWLKDETGQTLDQFELPAPRRVSFHLTDEQAKLLDDLFALHGNTLAGRGQALKLVPVNKLWRHPVVEQQA
jgi:radical SAM superfamily enzyme YgiQ (UPF0313 family)